MKVIHPPAELTIRQFHDINYVELIIRIATGLFLILDGVHILSHTSQLEELFRQVMSVPMAKFLIIFIGFAHLFGGTFIVLGLLTRIVIILQIPAILAEMYYIQPPNSFLGRWEILGSALLLILLVFLFVKNSGKFSLDYYRKKNRRLKTVQE
jgi:putative oxidoreductase